MIKNTKTYAINTPVGTGGAFKSMRVLLFLSTISISLHADMAHAQVQLPMPVPATVSKFDTYPIQYEWPVFFEPFFTTSFGNMSMAEAINTNGEIVGYATGPAQPCALFGQCASSKSFLVTNNQMQMINAADPTDLSSTAMAINDSGEIVGYSLQDIVVGAYYKAFSYKNGVVTKLPHLTPAVPSSIANSVNNAGQIVGISWNSAKQNMPVIWQNGTVASLVTLSGDSGGYAADINNAGVIVGYSRNNTQIRAVKWDRNGNITDLSIHSSYQFLQSHAEAVNDSGTVVGHVIFPAFPDVRVPAIWEANGNIVFPYGLTEGRALDVNNKNQVVGYVKTQIGQQAFLWDKGQTYILDYVVGAFVLSSANAINDKGYIVGQGSNNGTRAFMLKPKKGK